MQIEDDFKLPAHRADLVVSITVLVLVLLLLVLVALKPLLHLSELSLFRTYRLSGDFSLWGTICFEHFALPGPLPYGFLCSLEPFRDLCPFGPIILRDLLLFESNRLLGTFGFFSYCRQVGL